jgi:DNA-binding NarL/FixJ family response regulator
MDLVRVLLVDDSPILLSRITDFLAQYEEVVVVGTATSGEEALAQAKVQRPQMILLDLRMPGMSGLEAIPHLRAILPEAAIIILTLYDIDVYRQAALAAGADAFIPKRALHTDLLPAIRRVVNNAQ